jgi:S-adenosylmethionine:tRNA ribosyltransferase-isomerase
VNVRLSELNYNLPEELIAQEPARPRDSSRLLVLHRESGQIEDRSFLDLLSYLKPTDVVAMNDTQVIPARLYATVRHDPEKPVELLLLRQESEAIWYAMAKPGKRVRPGNILEFGHGVSCEVLGIEADGIRRLRFILDPNAAEEQPLGAALQQVGVPPLPPYITAPLKRPEDYQTVYARTPGAVAAPTAGLHFTPELLDKLRTQVRDVCTVTLHIGPWTFRPIKAETVEEHPMSTEQFTLSQQTVDVLNTTRTKGGRLLAVGTSTCRVLESCVGDDGRLAARDGDTALFIMPGFQFKAVDMLLTNFHLPKSTNLLLVCAFAGRQKVLKAYEHAVRERYRFFSFGDAMLIV